MRLVSVSVPLLFLACLYGSTEGLLEELFSVHDSGKSEENHHIHHHHHHHEKSNPKCAPNEVWYSCLPSCDITCNNLFKTCKFSDDRCHKGCECARGFARLRPSDPCVPISQCAKPESEEEECGKNELYTDCGNPCKERCPDRQRPCSTVCKRGCFCKRGYVRVDGKCVRDRVCSETEPPEIECRRNEVFSDCGDRCEEECDSYSKSRNCPQSCQYGCFCKPGFSRMFGTCVPKRMCHRRTTTTTTTTTTTKPTPTDPPTEKPVVCPANEFFSKCGSSCREQCSTGEVCPEVCQTGCFCKSGFKRVEGVCLADNVCQDCGPNAVLKRCGLRRSELCPGTATDATETCSPGCFCKSGYVRQGGVCVADQICAQMNNCGADEVWKDCGKDCTDECDAAACASDTRLCRGDCFCKAGLKRVAGKCVPTAACNPDPVCDHPMQVFTRNVRVCEHFCWPDPPTCPTTPIRDACICRPGYKFHVATDTCNLQPDCPLNLLPDPVCANPMQVYTRNVRLCEYFCWPDPPTCPATPIQNGCICRPGYRYHVATDTCNLPANCPLNTI